MKRTGFTLVELLIVMAVIAALISVVAPMGLNALKQARTVQVATDLRSAMNTIIGRIAAHGDVVDADEIDIATGYKTAMTLADAVSNVYTITLTNFSDKYDEKYLTDAFGASFDESAGTLDVDVTNYVYD
jgi:prepilin-type N-terminal cleavage/methylation domain-containing protein